MHLSRLIKIQLAIFAVVAAVAGSVMMFGYIKLPALLGVGHYTVTVELPDATGLYASGNVTYRGTEIGKVTDVRLSDTGAQAVLSLRSDVAIPADVDADVHSVSGIGEQYVALQPRSGNGPALKNGDVIPQSRTSLPPNVSALLDAANRGLEGIPHDNVKTVIDESYTAIGGLGPELSRLVKGSTELAIDARTNLDPLTALIDKSAPVLDSQADTSQAIHAWAAHLADITHQVQTNDDAVAGLLEKGPAAADQARQLIDRINPTLPVLLANLVSINPVLITYQPAIEQLLVLFPEGVAIEQAIVLANQNTGHHGMYLSFNLNFNVPPPCTTGYLPAQQWRNAGQTDTPDLPAGNFYCRIPQDAPNAVRGARNYPCLAHPGKRAPTAQMCESDEQYVPLNDGNNWKGDPNATLSGQDVPQQDSRTLAGPIQPAPSPAPAAAPGQIPIAMYDPATGSYLGPDGLMHSQNDLAKNPEDKTWQSMLIPPKTP
jgi:phospholipid/cholesterol/gamma-HCH transport system substrate-binding protein